MSALNTENLNRTIFISDNLPFLKSLDSESVDLVVTDPPFGKTRTFVGALDPPLTADERRIERDLMAGWGVSDADSAYELGLEYPDQTGTTAQFSDIWDFRVQVYEDWLERLSGRVVAHPLRAIHAWGRDSRLHRVYDRADAGIAPRSETDGRLVSPLRP